MQLGIMNSKSMKPPKNELRVRNKTLLRCVSAVKRRHRNSDQRGRKRTRPGTLNNVSRKPRSSELPGRNKTRPTMLNDASLIDGPIRGDSVLLPLGRNNLPESDLGTLSEECEYCHALYFKKGGHGIDHRIIQSSYDLCDPLRTPSLANRFQVSQKVIE